MKINTIFTRALGLMMVLTAASCGNPEQKFAITVTDEEGMPMQEVHCSAGFNLGKKDGPGISPYIVDGMTDSSGKVEIVGNTVFFDTSVKARHNGYYDSVIEKLWITGKNGNRWEPWPVEVNLVMKKIRNPKPMYVARFDNQKWHRFPNKKLGPFGFDLMKSDWVHPYGKGELADFLLEAVRDDAKDSDVMPKGRVILTFNNDKDGIFRIEDNGGSLLAGPSTVPANHQFLPEWIFDNFKVTPENANVLSNDFSDEVYIFRIRTKTDQNGNVISTHYGKIDGRIVGWLPQASPSILMTYYLNGTPNNRGLEWDMENNLIEDTSRMRIPRRP